MTKLAPPYEPNVLNFTRQEGCTQCFTTSYQEAHTQQQGWVSELGRVRYSTTINPAPTAAAADVGVVGVVEEGELVTLVAVV